MYDISKFLRIKFRGKEDFKPNIAWKKQYTMVANLTK